MPGVKNNLRRKAEAGFSILEVLIAIVILLIGVLAVIRIFPTGLDLIRSGSFRTVSVHLGQAELERWKNHPAGLADFIAPVFWDDTANRWFLSPGLQGREPLKPYKDQNGYEQLASLDFRLILGERAIVPSPTDTPNGPRGVYHLAHGLPAINPNLDGNGVGAGSNVTDGTLVVSATWSYQQVPVSALANDGTDYGQYAVFNATTGALQFDTDNSGDRWFSVDYVANVSSTPLAVFEELVRVPQGSATPSPATLAYGDLDPSTLTVRRAYRQGEYALDPKTGVLLFEPRTAGTPIRISYIVRDWQILQEERIVEAANRVDSNGNPLTVPVVRTTISYLRGGPNDPNYQGLDPNGLSPISEPLIIVDLATGQPVNFDNTLAVRDDYANALVGTGTDYKGGEIGLLGNVYAGQRVRVFYRTQDHWAVQTQRASRAYLPEVTSSPAPLSDDPRRYRVTLDNGYITLLFRASEAGKSVAVTYRFRERAGALPTRVEGELHTLTAEPTDYYNTPADPTDDVCFVRLNEPITGSRVFNPANDPSTGIECVEGTSLKVRTSWQEKSNRRYEDLETYLTGGS